MSEEVKDAVIAEETAEVAAPVTEETVPSMDEMKEELEKSLKNDRKDGEAPVWEKLAEMMEKKTVISVTVEEAVKAGVVAFVDGVRGFIPASQIGLTYIEDLTTVVGQTIDVIAITVDTEKRRLVLSGKEVAKMRAAEEKAARLAGIGKGAVLTGKVETIMPFGAFVNLGEGISGLVHISQISRKRVENVEDALKVGDEVQVKVLEVKDKKISLSIKALDAKAPVAEEAPAVDAGPRSYREDGEATTGLAALLKNIKLN